SRVINEFILIYKTLESVSLSKVESGESTIVDVLRIQLKIQYFNQELNIIGNARGLFFEGKSLPIRIPISRLKNKIAAQLFESYHI
ncbi:MAG: hypothetical protein HRT73_12570, partial [Flavobacteriales bacterium]|nr:hypothetical protein [Flavobacteriales bacterium]